MQIVCYVIVAVTLITAVVPQEKEADVCSSRTVLAYHSPQCNWGYVVRDPNRAEDVKIEHDPPYHTYSRWRIVKETYVFAYRDIDGQPDNMVADIYKMRGVTYKLIGNVRIPGIVSDVSTASLTGGELPDVIFRFKGGQLQYVDIVRFTDGTAQQVFQYGASTIRILCKPKPMIEATSKVADMTEQFTWDFRKKEFKKVRYQKLKTMSSGELATGGEEIR
jgi:hypothetical protein